MQKRLTQLVVLLVGALASGFVFAHPGHDHGHWISTLVHIIFIASMLAVAAAIGYIAFKRYHKKHANE